MKNSFSSNGVASNDLATKWQKASNGLLSLEVIRNSIFWPFLYVSSLPKESYWNQLSFGMSMVVREDSGAKPHQLKCECNISDWWLLLLWWFWSVGQILSMPGDNLGSHIICIIFLATKRSPVHSWTRLFMIGRYWKINSYLVYFNEIMIRSKMLYAGTWPLAF